MYWIKYVLFSSYGTLPQRKISVNPVRTCRKMEVRIETKTGNIFLELSAFSKQTNRGPILFFLNSISQTSKESQTQILTKCFKEGPGLVLR